MASLGLRQDIRFVPNFVESVKQMVVLLHSAHLDSKYKISRMSMCDDPMHVED